VQQGGQPQNREREERRKKQKINGISKQKESRISVLTLRAISSLPVAVAGAHLLEEKEGALGNAGLELGGTLGA
jgi:hypothetical protein